MLTQKEIDSAKPKAKEYTLQDVKRLALRIRPTGSKVWIYKYMWEGKIIPMTIKGRTLAQIRAQANTFNEWLDIGIRQEDGTFVKTSPKYKLEADDQRVKAEIDAERIRLMRERLEAESRITVSQLFERWMRLGLSERKDTKEIRRMFNKDVLPTLGHLLVEDIRKANIVQVLNDIQARGVTRMLKLMLSQMRQMFRFAVDQDIIESDPTASIRKDKVGGRDTVRDRVLEDKEIKQLYGILPSSGLSKHAQAAVWLMLSTCCRVGELMAAEWSHIDLVAGTWTIPAENAKNGKKHTIYLSTFALSQFSNLENLNIISKWVFPNARETGAVCNKTLAKQIGDRQQAIKSRMPMSGRSKQTDSLVLDGGKWTPHDLRRTGATIMGSLNVRPDVIEKCLNHIEQNKIIRTYQHQTLIPEQVEAWQLLGQRLQILTSGDSSVFALSKPA